MSQIKQKVFGIGIVDFSCYTFIKIRLMNYVLLSDELQVMLFCLILIIKIYLWFSILLIHEYTPILNDTNWLFCIIVFQYAINTKYNI